ncbi:MAG: helix-turn-helix domain-containing protein, partial [Deltaproteobacteria bacterium]|nr:helix-turn-helix domain-containing protein [Deltaproteobacteria bacterium]
LRHVAIGEAYNAGESIEKIMARYNIKLVTVLDHLFKYVLEGNKIRSDGLLSVSALSQKKIQAVLETFDRLGTEYLSPIYKKNKGKISYEDLKIIRLYDLSKKSSKNI